MLQTKNDVIAFLTDLYGVLDGYVEDSTKAAYKAEVKVIENLTSAELAKYISKYYE